MAMQKDVARNLGELLIQDVFAKHHISPEKRKPISPEQKAQLRNLVQNLEEQVQQFLDAQSNPVSTKSNNK